MSSLRKLTVALIAIVSLVSGSAAGVLAGPVGGPRTDIHRVEARSTDTFVIAFYGGEPAVVVVQGDGDTDLDLYVYDENGNLIASDTGPTDTCIVTFHPRWTGPFIIRVRNLGPMYNLYIIGIR